MSDRDRELDKILEPLARLQPSADQMRRWSLVRPRRNQGLTAWVIQLTAAACIGFVVGAFFFKGQGSNPTENFDSSATLETVYYKTQ